MIKESERRINERTAQVPPHAKDAQGAPQESRLSSKTDRKEQHKALQVFALLRGSNDKTGLLGDFLWHLLPI